MYASRAGAAIPPKLKARIQGLLQFVDSSGPGSSKAWTRLLVSGLVAVSVMLAWTCAKNRTLVRALRAREDELQHHILTVSPCSPSALPPAHPWLHPEHCNGPGGSAPLWWSPGTCTCIVFLVWTLSIAHADSWSQAWMPQAWRSSCHAWNPSHILSALCG